MQHFASLRFQPVAVQMLVFFLHLTEAFENLVHLVHLRRVFHLLLQMFQLMVQIADAPAARNGFIEHAAALHLLHILAEIPDRQLLGHGDVTIIGRFLAHDHAEQRGLAGPVGTHQTGLFAGIQLEGSFYENELLAVLFTDVAEGDHSLPR